MTRPVDLYDSHYEKAEDPIYREIRAEAFGLDMGQTSWITAAECEILFRMAGLTAGRHVLEVACGSGGLSAHMAEQVGVTVVGVDINAAGIKSAAMGAGKRGLSDQVSFQVVDADQPLPFPDGIFDVVICNDAINHFRDRGHVLREWFRVLRPGGRCLYTDPIVVTGFLSNEEIAVRSSIGFFLFTPPGANEKVLSEAGFVDIDTLDVTDGVATSSRNWRDARGRRRDALIAREGKDQYEDLQRFLGMVHTLSSEGRLSRFVYVGMRP